MQLLWCQHKKKSRNKVIVISYFGLNNPSVNNLCIGVIVDCMGQREKLCRCWCIHYVAPRVASADGQGLKSSAQRDKRAALASGAA
jgi:hypothetical protein